MTTIVRLNCPLPFIKGFERWEGLTSTDLFMAQELHFTPSVVKYLIPCSLHPLLITLGSPLDLLCYDINNVVIVNVFVCHI